MTDNPRCFKEKNRLLPDQVNLYHMLQLSFEQKKELNVAYLGGMNSCAFVSQEATPDGVNERHYDLSTRSNTDHWGLVVSHHSQQNKVRWRNMQIWETCHLSTHFMWWKTLFGKEVHVVMVKRAAPVGMWAVMGHHPLPCAVSVNIYHELPPCCTNVVICAPSSLSFYGVAFTLRYRISFLGDDPYSTLLDIHVYHYHYATCIFCVILSGIWWCCMLIWHHHQGAFLFLLCLIMQDTHAFL